MSDDKVLDPIALLGRAWVAKNEGPAETPATETNVEAEDVGYARRSSVYGTEVSIERQEEGILHYATRTGRKVGGTFADRGKSGATLRGRDGLNEIMRRAKEGKVSKVIVEDVDRLGRDLALLATCFKDLTKLGVEIHSVAKGGKLDLSDIAMRGYLSQEQRQIIMRNCVQGRKKLASRGLVPSGRCWGYLGVPGKPGHLIIDEDVRPHVVMFFELLLQGATPVAIAHHANEKGIKCLRGGLWDQTAIRRVVSNPRYAGKLIYGRSSHHVDLDTGERTVTRKAAHEWISRVDEKLRIVSEEMWFAAQERLAQKRFVKRSPRRNYILTKKIHCPECGGVMGVRTSKQSVALISCATATLKGSVGCSHTRLYPMKDIERGVLDFLRPFLDDPETIESYFDAIKIEHTNRTEGAQRTLEKADADVRLARDRLDRFFDDESELLADLGKDEVARQRRRYSQALQEAEAVRVRTRAIARQAPSVDRSSVATLLEAFDDVFASVPFRPSDVAGQHVAAILQDLIERVEIFPIAGSTVVQLRTHLSLGAHSVVEGVPSSESDVVVHGAIALDAHYAARSHQKRSDIAEMLEARRGFMSDVQWQIAQKAVGEYAPVSRLKGVSTREALDRVIFALRHGTSFSSVAPMIDSTPVKLRDFAHYLARSGYWNAIVRVFSAEDPAFLIGVPCNFFERYQEAFDHANQCTVAATERARENRVAEGRRSVRRYHPNQWRRISKPLVPPLLARLAAREGFMSDKVYAHIEPIVALYKPTARESVLPIRELLDRIFFCLRTGLPLSHPTQKLPVNELRLRRVGDRFAASGFWDRVVERLEKEAPEFLANTDYRFFDHFKDYYARKKAYWDAYNKRYHERMRKR